MLFNCSLKNTTLADYFILKIIPLPDSCDRFESICNIIYSKSLNKELPRSTFPNLKYQIVNFLGQVKVMVGLGLTDLGVAKASKLLIW